MFIDAKWIVLIGDVQCILYIAKLSICSHQVTKAGFHVSGIRSGYITYLVSINYSYQVEKIRVRLPIEHLYYDGLLYLHIFVYSFKNV